MKKKDIRHYYKDRRMQLSASQMNRMDDLMLIQFQRLSIDIPSLIMTYAPIEKWNEFNPELVTDYCYFKNPNQQLLYPFLVDLEGKAEMIAVIADEHTTFEKNQFGIDEPVNGVDIPHAEIDMVIVPLLGFDTKGYRVGYGKGYYDRFLLNCRKDCIKVGFSYFEPVEAIEDENPLDVPLDFCITHEKIYSF